MAAEIARAFLVAGTATEVYRVALARVTPLVGAQFGSVFLRDAGEPELLKLACAHNWPQSAARWLGALRVREGRGPTGRAVAARRAVEVEDVAADPAAAEWRDPARELGFASLIALPLLDGDEVQGALTFYFRGPRRFDEETRRLVALVADQLAATACRAQLEEDLRAANAALRQSNQELRVRVREAEDAKRLRDEFLGNVTHELRTPLSSIMGYTYLLKAGQAGKISDQARAAVARAEEAAQLLLRLVDDLLELSRLKLGNVDVMVTQAEAVGIARAAREVAGRPPDGVVFELRHEEERIPLRTDVERATRVLAHLLANAFKFTERGMVTLDVVASGGRVNWIVRDTGSGIPPAEAELAFDEFRQLDGGVDRRHGGVGLGLAVARRTARLLGGDVSLAPAAEGGGSLFTFWLPLVEPEAADAAGASGAAEASGAA
ncbi:MAG: GAF domain-containing sensor histidine kinase, partial [Gemmatimonadota bacterium]